ncbi:pyruvate dehydrogenase complex dihydrolipoamide acetyltransferase [Flavobacterium sp. DG1-102-2]|uniref:pyruvate dehydrogenase complex dihydrolipoamide acetyltransferase n=1 Tax=Flavobacterium sp. DG1-102-2 TaxID=3081663 RepID=UPI0029498B61|nr:pyruvate dehydrogenase complex dihydrolipoamide acetyltransferase [Flavobacterium sp. DG1-102-2]MDV6168246.1 pyruvate dehydrogenase complex dihydrolipoamide acetyltransferase [Flavobacterium sp. DG1-102-2]
MAKIINMPRLSDTMTEGTVATWLKKVGDTIKEGDILAEIETDKATMEFEAFDAGTLLHIGIQEGETAPVDAILAIIGKEGEDISSLLDGKAAPAAETEKKEEPKKEEAAPEAKTEEKAAEAPKAAASSELPKGVIIVTMPRLSDTMTEGTVATWLKKEGDTIKEGDILAEIETDKATMEFESFNAGTLLKIGIQEGQTASVDSLLAIIGPAGTDVSGITGKEASAPAAEAKADAPKEDKKEADAAPAAKAEEAPAAANDGGRLFVSPLARKIAEEKGVNLNQVKGSGENGRIVKKDIENYTPQAAQPAATAAAPAQSAAAPAAYVPAGEVATEEVKNNQMRKTIARRLAESKFTAPEYSLTIELDMDNAIASRNTINAVPDTKVSFNDMVIKASAMALRKHPQVNTQWKDDVTVYNKHISIGVAVAVEDGLVVPVVKFTDNLSLSQIGGAVKDLAGKARNKKLSPAEMDGSTFTVSNLGMFGIQEFTSIINQPNSAILSVGAIVQKPVVKNGQIVVGNTMTVTLTCDHRTIDGATGAQFLQTLKQYVENPVTMLA